MFDRSSLPTANPRSIRSIRVQTVLGAGLACLALALPVGAQDVPDAQRDAAYETLDATMHRVANEVPEFGGVFRDDDGALAVYLTNPAQKDRAQMAIERALGAASIGSTGLRVLQGRYGFGELSLYRTMVQPALAMKGVVYTDLDEAHNRVTVGVERAADGRVVELDLQRYGVPAEALRVVVSGPIFSLATLRDRTRPVVGGLQIQFGSFLCTDGFMATRAGVRGFVTNSHCTGRQGGVTGTVYYQPTSATPRIGVETADPNYVSGGACPAGRRCRWSDSAFVRFDSAVASNRGKIARTNGPGSLTINTTTPRFRIVGETGAPLAGETLNKVGRTTGWSRGIVTTTCATVLVSGTTIALFCQDIVTARALPGDSGSPVFKVITNPDRVRLYGILWGGNSSGTMFAFSRLSNIQRELGTLTTCDAALAGC
jgi:hypothetical protein